MTLALELLCLLGLLELVSVSKRCWPVRRPLCAGLIVTLALVTGSILGQRFSVAMVLITVISMYRVINLLRVMEDRSQEQYIQWAVRRTTLILTSAQVIIIALLAISDQHQPAADAWWALLSIVQLMTTAALYASTRRQLRTTRPLAVSQHFSDSHLPSLSVCIPARNETTDLSECLRSLLSSTYPKLEIVVLDDCSQGPRTSDIIRSFAHDGVRFIKGQTPPDSWLAKNWAYQQLFEATSGKLVLFCGVDIRFEPSALRSLITTQLAKDKRMMSVIPRNVVPRGVLNQVSLLIQPARYAWELTPPRRLFNRPPILSSCWVAERSLVDHTGAFAAVKHSISPEAYFARKATFRDGYSFVQSTAGMDISSQKTPREQWSTAVRTHYPQIRRRPEMVFAVTAIECALLVAPPFLALVGIIQGLWLQALCASVATVLIAVTYAMVTRVTYRRFLGRSLVLAPFATLLDIYLRHESLWQYEFGEISWKGRNICLPVMRVIPRFSKS